MRNSDFLEVRRLPKERQLVFVPEVQLALKLKETEQETQVSVKQTQDLFVETVHKLFPSLDQDTLQAMIAAISRLRNPDNYDSYILAVAAYYYVRFPVGLDLVGENRQGMLSQAITFSQEFNTLASDIGSVYSKQESAVILKIKQDIIAYYLIILSSQ